MATMQRQYTQKESKEQQIKRHTNNCSAVGEGFESTFAAMVLLLTSIKFGWLDVKSGSRKGFRDTGRGGGSSKGETAGGDVAVLRGLAGDAARLRNGLLDDRFRVNPADRPVPGPVYCRERLAPGPTRLNACK